MRWQLLWCRAAVAAQRRGAGCATDRAHTVRLTHIHTLPSPQLCDLYESDCIFDKFDCVMSGDGRYFATGTYSNFFRWGWLLGSWAWGSRGIDWCMGGSLASALRSHQALQYALRPCASCAG